MVWLASRQPATKMTLAECKTQYENLYEKTKQVAVHGQCMDGLARQQPGAKMF
jgi:hypothetical protein